jgi:ABC-type multidrug transport system fused ATPase/permease subunit
VKEPDGLREDHTARRLPVATLATVRAHAVDLVRVHRSELVRVGLWHAAAALAALAAPWVIGQLVEEVTHARRGDRVNQLLLVLAVGLLAQTVLTWFARRAAFVLAEGIFARIREDFVASTVRLPLSVVERAGTGDLVARTTGDVDALSFVVRKGIPDLLVAGTTILVTVVAALLTAPLAVLTFVVAPLLLWNPVRIYLRRALPGYRWERATYARVAGVAAETAHGLATVDALGRSRRREAAHRAALAESERAEHWTLRFRLRFFPWVDIAFGSLVAATALWSGWLSLQGMVTLGSAVAVTLYAQQIIDPIGEVVGWLDEIQVAATGYSRLLGVSEVPPDRTPTGAQPEGTALVVDDVSYAYRPGHDVLRGVSVDLRPGERLAIVGPSGAGKSTLGRLMAGVDAPRNGEIRCGGVPLVGLDLPALRGEVALVTQEHHVFVGTLADNLRLPRPQATDEELLGALAAVDADGWAQSLPEGLATRIGSGGHPLTEPQAQQLALARLVLADPHTLVLDEATSLLDPRAARHLERSLAAVVAGRTVVAIAHRLHTAHDADRVCVMEDGAITELGSHAQLLASDGSYAALWRSWRDE